MVFLSKLHIEKINSDLGGKVAWISMEYLEIMERAALIKKTVVEKRNFTEFCSEIFLF